jgi:hypothetical protein
MPPSRRRTGVIQRHDQRRDLLLGKTWLDGSAVAAEDEVEIDIDAEGPQRSDLPTDVAAALAANPRTGEFFDGLAQFYRRLRQKRKLAEPWCRGTTGGAERRTT